MTSEEKLRAFLKAQQFREAAQWVTSWTNKQLAQFQCANPQYHNLLQEPAFDEFWHNRLTTLRLGKHPSFHFQSQPGLKDADLVTGYLLYILAVKKGDKELESRADFVNNVSMHLVRQRLHSVFIQLDQANQAEVEKFAAHLYNLEAFARLHGSPGYLLLTNGYMQLGFRYKQLMAMEQVAASYQTAWKYLHLAQLAEEGSEASINNAYFGQGLGLSNPYQLNSLAEMKALCTNVAGDLLPLTTQRIEENNARLAYQHNSEFGHHEETEISVRLR